jgi:hypothetical protein
MARHAGDAARLSRRNGRRFSSTAAQHEERPDDDVPTDNGVRKHAIHVARPVPQRIR